MVVNLSKTFHETQSFFILSSQKKVIFVLGGTVSRESKFLKFTRSSQTSAEDKKNLYQITYIFCNPVSSVFIQSFDTNLLAPRRTLGFQCICRAQLNIQTKHIHYRLPSNYVTSLLAYCRG